MKYWGNVEHKIVIFLTTAFIYPSDSLSQISFMRKKNQGNFNLSLKETSQYYMAGLPCILRPALTVT
jgi:hypothetical protein